MSGLFDGFDHVGIAVRNADTAIPFYRDVLGLELVGDEIADEPGVRLVYFQIGDAAIQLVEPVLPHSSIHAWLEEHGDGLHHICLSTDDLSKIAIELPGQEGPIFRAGRNQRACFLADEPNGVKVEVTERRPSFRAAGR